MSMTRPNAPAAPIPASSQLNPSLREGCDAIGTIVGAGPAPRHARSSGRTTSTAPTAPGPCVARSSGRTPALVSFTGAGPTPRHARSSGRVLVSRAREHDGARTVVRTIVRADAGLRGHGSTDECDRDERQSHVREALHRFSFRRRPPRAAGSRRPCIRAVAERLQISQSRLHHVSDAIQARILGPLEIDVARHARRDQRREAARAPCGPPHSRRRRRVGRRHHRGALGGVAPAFRAEDAAGAGLAATNHAGHRQRRPRDPRTRVPAPPRARPTRRDRFPGRPRGRTPGARARRCLDGC